MLAAKAHEAEALLGGAFVQVDLQLVEHVLDKLAAEGLGMKLHACAVVENLRHGHVVEGCVLL